MTIALPGTPVVVATVGAVGVVVVAIVGAVATAVAVLVLVLTAVLTAAVVAMLVLEAVLELGLVAAVGELAAAGAGRLSATVVAATRPAAARQHRDMSRPPVLGCALMGAPSSHRPGRS